MRKIASILAAALIAAGCGGGDEPPDAPLIATEEPHRFWSFSQCPDTFTGCHASPPVSDSELGQGEQTGGVLDKLRRFGGQFVSVASSLGDPERAEGNVYSNETGKTYWVWAESPLAGDGLAGSGAHLQQTQTYLKRADDATLELVITSAFIEAIDFNGDIIAARECPWLKASGKDTCLQAMQGELQMEIVVLPIGTQNHSDNLGYWFSEIGLAGWQGQWSPRAPTVAYINELGKLAGGTVRPVWSEADFEFDPDVGGLGNSHARLKLKQAVRVQVDLSRVPRDSEFALFVRVHAKAVNRRGRESYIAAYLRDPVNLGGNVEHVTSGLEPTNRPFQTPPAATPADAVACDAPNPEAGVIQFSAERYTLPEWGGAASPITITRSGGSRGEVSVHFTASGGSAGAGSDYTPVSGHVRFADGDSVPRVIPLPVVADDVVEDDKTIELVLSEPGGCAELGTHNHATLTLLDDDRPIAQDPTYKIGGSISGLQGSGLVVEEAKTSARFAAAANGTFVFDRPYSSGDIYDVRIATQPTNPAQACSVVNGGGTIAAADVADVAVSCTTVAFNGALDASFGSLGKVTSELLGPGNAVALHADDRIVVIGEDYLARFDRDGRLDPSFGVGGVVRLGLRPGSPREEALDIAVQPDDKIVVAGSLRVGDYAHMAALRFNADGSPDASFGTGGRATIHPFADLPPQSGAQAANAKAERVLLLPDGKMLLAGWAGFSTPSGSSVSFAIARLNADGSPDTSLGGDGAATHGSQFDRDIAYAVALQDDGKIVLGGRAGLAAIHDIGMARFNADGTADVGGPLYPNGDADPDTWYGRDGDGFQISETGAVEGEVVDLVLLPDGSTAGVVQSGFGGDTPFALGRFGGGPQGGGGLGSVTTTSIGPGDDIPTALAKQPDGKLVMVGQASSDTVNDFGVIRYNTDLSLDASFGSNGIVTVDFFGASDYAQDVVVQRGGGIVVVGAGRNGTRNRFAMARLLP